MSYAIIDPDDLPWITRPHADDEPARHVRELSDASGFAEVRANQWRYEPGARGRRHRHPLQEETFLVLSGTLTLYLGEPAQRHELPAGRLARVSPGTPLQAANHSDVDVLVHVSGHPGEDEHAELLPDAV